MHLTARPVTARRPKPPSWHTGPSRPAPRSALLPALLRTSSPPQSIPTHGPRRGHRQPRQLIARSVRWRSETTRKHPAICQVTSSKRPKPAGLPPACLHRTVTAWRLHGMRYPPNLGESGSGGMRPTGRAERVFSRSGEPTRVSRRPTADPVVWPARSSSAKLCVAMIREMITRAAVAVTSRTTVAARTRTRSWRACRCRFSRGEDRAGGSPCVCVGRSGHRDKP